MYVTRLRALRRLRARSFPTSASSRCRTSTRRRAGRDARGPPPSTSAAAGDARRRVVSAVRRVNRGLVAADTASGRARRGARREASTRSTLARVRSPGSGALHLEALGHRDDDHVARIRVHFAEADNELKLGEHDGGARGRGGVRGGVAEFVKG